MVRPTPSSTLSRELRRIGTFWPPDILRPRLQYGIYLAALSESQHVTPRMVRASQLLLENKLKEKYALSDRMMEPASYPDKYVRLVGLLDKAAESKPSWWRRFWTEKDGRIVTWNSYNLKDNPGKRKWFDLKGQARRSIGGSASWVARMDELDLHLDIIV